MFLRLENESFMLIIFERQNLININPSYLLCHTNIDRQASKQYHLTPQLEVSNTCVWFNGELVYTQDFTNAKISTLVSLSMLQHWIFWSNVLIHNNPVTNVYSSYPKRLFINYFIAFCQWQLSMTIQTMIDQRKSKFKYFFVWQVTRTVP